jgi:hypothetical protein
MKSVNRLMVTLLASVACVGVAQAQWQLPQTSRQRVVTDHWGSRLEIVQSNGTGDDISPAGVLWTYRNTFAAISSSVSFGAGTGSGRVLWAGQSLNGERIQTFAVPGNGSVLNEYAVQVNSPVGVSASPDVDRVAVLDGVEYNGPFQVRMITSAGGGWSFDVPSPYSAYYASRVVKISRDGSTIVAGFSYYDQVLQQSFARAYFFNAADGSVRSVWNGNGGITAVDVSDDGSTALITNDFNGRVIDTATGTQSFNTTGAGSGGWYVISGNGNTIVVGGFDMRVFRRVGSSWTNVINFSAPNQWFAWGFAVSRDGNTVVSMSHMYLTYLETHTRAWDVPSGALLGTYSTAAGGSLQSSISGAACSDDGSTFAVSTWGSEDNAHPEVHIFDRGVNLVGTIDTIGSVFALSMSPDGRYVASGSKAAHANTFGNGGDVVLWEGEPLCEADYNGDTVVDFFDYLDFVAVFSGGGPAADYNGDTVVDLFDYLDFVAVFAFGCE